MAPSRPSTAKKHGFGSTITTKSKKQSTKKSESLPNTQSLPQYYELTNKIEQKEENPSGPKSATQKDKLTQKQGSKGVSKVNKNGNINGKSNKKVPIPSGGILPQYHELSGGISPVKRQAKPKVPNSYLGIISHHQKQHEAKIQKR